MIAYTNQFVHRFQNKSVSKILRLYINILYIYSLSDNTTLYSSSVADVGVLLHKMAEDIEDFIRISTTS